MTTARDAFHDGRLADAVQLQSAHVEAVPDDTPGRLFLVELLALTGRYRDAWDQLSRIESDSPDWPAARRRFRRLLKAANRRANGRVKFINDPPPHARQRALALRALLLGDSERAIARIDRADSRTPHLFGHIDGREFDGLRDADDRFASVLEVLIGAEYVWVPWEHVRRLRLVPAKHPLDAAFRPAELRLSDWSEQAVFVPLVYPGTADDDVLLLGQDTDLVGDGGPVCGVGGKLLLLGDGSEGPLADCTQIDVRGSSEAMGRG